MLTRILMLAGIIGSAGLGGCSTSLPDDGGHVVPAEGFGNGDAEGVAMPAWEGSDSKSAVEKPVEGSGT